MISTCLPKTSSLKQAGWFKKLFKKIAKIFAVVVATLFTGVLGGIIAAGFAFGKQIAKGITKALTTLFGKTIGGALAGVLAFPFSFLGNTAHFIGQGDVKGLFKYWGQSALQIAMTALMFIPGVGQVLWGALQFVLQPILAIGKFLIGGALQVLGVTFSGMGQFFTGFSQGLGGFFKGVGGTLRSYGQSLVGQAKNFFNTGIKDIFAKLKAESFSLRKLWDQTLQSFKNQLNPVTYYKNLWGDITKTLNNLGNQTGISRLLRTVTEKIGIQIAQDKIDKSLEKSKMGSFLKGILSSVSGAALQGLGSSIFRGGEVSLPSQGTLETQRGRAPPTGLSGFFERISSAFSSVSGLITDALKDTTGFIKSLFIREDSSLPPNSQIIFSPEGEASFYKPLDGKIDLAYALEALPQGLHQARLDGGDWQFFKLDPQTKFILSQERIGNLETRPSFIQSLRGFADQADLFLDTYTNPAIDFFGPIGVSSLSTQIFLGREYAKGLIDTLRLGDQFAAIKSDFLSAQASFQKGDYLNAAKSFGSAGLRSFTEAGRFANLVPLFGLATKGIGGLGQGAQRARILANLAESQAARNASRFGLEGFNLAEDGFRISKANALRLLENRGLDSARARNFINSFEGPLTVRRARPEEAFLRYARQPDEPGNFLTKDLFGTPQDATRELHLERHNNPATFLQDVRSRGTPIVIEGQAKGSPSKIRQYLINPDDFEFRKGRRYYG